MLKSVKKKIFILILRPFLSFFFSFFFDKKYLKGKFFDLSIIGWGWAFRSLIFQKCCRINNKIPWPVNLGIAIDEPNGIFFDPDDINNFQTFGCYFSNAHGGKIIIGKGTMIAPNVGIITTNHELTNPDRHQQPKDVIIGKKCWIGMGAIILPGVVLADNIVIGANSVVTKSFLESNLVIAGNPAKVIRKI